MFRRIVLVMMLGSIMLVPVSTLAQEEEETQSYSYATYSQCDLAEQQMADEIHRTVQAPVFDAAVEDGTITGWGYLAHNTGGKWRRLRYFGAPSLAALFDAQEKIFSKIEEKSPTGQRQFSKICNAHDDYIWRFVTGSGGPEAALQNRGKVSFSTYFICDEAREQRADEIMKETMAPVFDRQVADGKAVTWGWLEHWVGGKYRRLQTLTATDLESLMAARDGAILELVEKHSEATEEFSSICSSHQDYIWEIQMEKP